MKKSIKKIAFKVETVRKLSNTDLQHVAGGAFTNLSACVTNCHASECVCPPR